MPVQTHNVAEPIAGYMLRERIGAGGYGEVWKADAPGGLMKAVKLVYGYLNEDRATTEMKAFNRIKQVRHPFLLSLERIEVVDGQLVIVTELADSSLKDWYEQCRKAAMPGIPRDELLLYMRDAADALDYMSKHFSLQHLDVKPENLLLVAGHVKVGDFGLVKDLREGTASIMQGMTPIYAPPEVFDGRASSQSDQYSLAIVFQEMLTSQLPFPGRTLAQLAAQHLHSPPRINMLPPADRPIVERALSKDPKARFATCMEFVEALTQAGKIPAAPPSSVETRAASASDAATAVFTSPAAHKPAKGEASPDWPGGIADPNATQAAEAPSTSDTADLPFAFRPERPSERVEVIEGQLHVSFTDLPPVEAPSAFQLRPTLFLGVGGGAGKVLSRLASRAAHLGGLNADSALQMLLLDTDAEALAALSRSGPALSAAQSLPLPLRRAQDYRADSKRFLQWMSRRWLYNVPRSHLTEGLRPLGRLAYVDHFSEIRRRIEAAISAILRPEAVARLAETSGAQVLTDAPRIVIVANISGGAGGGIALDLAYLVRSLLAERGLSDRCVTGLLMFAADSNAADRELSVVNAYGTLSELYHYSAGGGRFPGDAVCGLPARTENGAPFADTYVVNLGEGLSDQRYDAQLDKVAEYLYRDCATRAAGVLDVCRQEGSRQSSHARSDVPLRSFGLASCRILPGDITAVIESLAAQILEALLGPPEPAPTGTARTAASPGSTWGRKAKESPATVAAREMSALVAARRNEQRAETSRGPAAAIVGEAIGDPLPEVAAYLVEQLRAPARAWASAFEASTTAEPSPRFIADLYSMVEQTVCEVARRADLAARALPAAPAESAVVSGWLQRATPLLLAGEASRRLVVCAPQESAVAGQIGAIIQRAGAAPSTLVADSDPGVALIYEAEQVSLAQLAAALIEQRPEFAEAASRMHTRMDIRWSPLPDVRPAS